MSAKIKNLQLATPALDHPPVENFYLTGYNAVSGSFSSGSVVGGTSGSGGTTGVTDVLMVQVFS